MGPRRRVVGSAYDLGQAMDRDKLNEIWREAERLRDRRPVDLSVLVDVAGVLGPVTWRDVAELALHERGSEVARPLHLLEFIAELARALRPETLLDPWVATPTILAAAHAESGSARSCGLVWNERLLDIGQRIAPLDWRRGEPLRLLRDLADERFDLVIAAPPAGLRLPVDRVPGDPGGRVDVSDLILWRVGRLLAEGGHVLFHTADSFFWAQTRRPIWRDIAEYGLHAQAVVSVERGFGPATSFESSLVLFGSQMPDELFVGRLDRGTSIPALVENLLAHRVADDPHLGALTPAGGFRGWRRFAVERELAAIFDSSDLRPLAEIGSVRRVQLKPGMPYDPAPNCVLVPTLGFGNVMTVPPDLEGKSGYTLVELQLDPDLARAEYVAGFLSSPPGKQLRESVASGSTVPSLSATAVAEIRVPLPPLEVQAVAVQSAAQLASMEATIARMRRDLWRRPEEAPRLLSEFTDQPNTDPVRRWQDTLPYPLASVLQRATAIRDTDERVARLLHFYEITAEFACAVLMSILWRDPELLDAARSEVASAAGPGRNLFDRADYGLWINLGATLAKAIRRLNGQPDYHRRLTEAAGPATELMSCLADRRIWRLLDQPRPIRNARAHGGVVTPRHVEAWLGTLEALLSDVEQALGSGFDDVDLARADQGRFSGGLHVYPRAQRLRGSSEVFQEFEVRTRVPLESEHLAFVERDAPISDVLMLVPLVRVGPTMSTSRNACYFFDSRVKGGGFSYVSYHFEDEPRLNVEDAELQRLVLELAAPPR